MRTTLEQRIVTALETVSDAEPLYTERDDARVGRAGAYRLYVYPVRTIMGTRHRAVAHYQTSGMAVGQRIAGEAVADWTSVADMVGLLRHAKKRAERLERTCSRLQDAGWNVSAETRYGCPIGLSVEKGAVSVHLSSSGIVVGGDAAAREYVSALWVENDG